MKKLPVAFIFFLSLVFTVSSFAQKSGKISGVFLDSKTRESIPAVGVQLLKLPDSTQVAALFADGNGKFLIEPVSQGKYTLMASMLGYKKKEIPVELKKSDSEVNLGEILLETEATQLAGVEVISQKPLIEHQAGKIVMNVAENPTTTGDNVLELLKKVPGVTVDNNDNITLNGKSGITILLDDKPTYVSGEALSALLKNMSSDQIEKIEVMNNPSSKYDAEGAAGIINIKTKRNNNIGINGSVYASGGYAGNKVKHSEGADLSFRSGKWILYGSANNSYYPYKNSSVYTRELANGNRFETNRGDGEDWQSGGSSKNQSFKLGADYYIDKKNVVGFLWRSQGWSSDNDNYSNTRIFNQDVLDSSYREQNNSENSSGNNTFNLNYKHTFDSTGRFLSFDVDYVQRNTDYKGTENTRYYMGDDFSQNPYRIENYLLQRPITSDILSFKSDYMHPFTKTLSLEAGIKVSFVENDNDQKSYLESVMDSTRTNHFIYNENIFAAYAIVNKQFSEKTSLQLGLRYELTDTKGHLLNPDITNDQKPYGGLFPNINFHQQLTKNQALDVSYRYRLSRPNYRNLNPFIYRDGPYSISMGNPGLKPQYTHTVDISHSFFNKLFTSIGYNYEKDDYSRIQYFDTATNITTSIPQNIGKGQSIYADISFQGNITKWWMSSNYLWANLSVVDFDYGTYKVNNKDKPNYSFGLWSGQYFTLPKNFTAELTCNYHPKSRETFSDSRSQFSLSAGLKKTFFDKKLTARVSVNDLLNSSGSWEEKESYPDGTKTDGVWRWESRQVWLSVSYRFGKQDIQPRQRKSASDDEQGRMGNGGGSGTGKTGS